VLLASGAFRFHEGRPGVRLTEKGRPAAALSMLVAGAASGRRGGHGTLGPGGVCGLARQRIGG
jgi:hypothetical protein